MVVQIRSIVAAMAIIVLIAGPAFAQADDSAKTDDSAKMTDQNPSKPMKMRKHASHHVGHHKGDCYNAAYQSQEWNDCVAKKGEPKE